MAPEVNMAVLRAENLSFTYPDGTVALTEVGFVLQPGERVGIIGANGSGKTTLARTLNGLLAPSSGQVWVDDWDTSVAPASLIATKVGYVFTSPRQQLFLPQVMSEVLFGPRNLGWDEVTCQNRAKEALETVGLWEKRAAYCQELGGCSRKRLAWATVLAMQPEAVIFDEPSAALDASASACLERVMATLSQRGTTTVIISHDMDFVADHCQRLLVLDSGRLVVDAPLNEAWETAEKLGLDVPCARVIGHEVGLGAVGNGAELLERAGMVCLDAKFPIVRLR